MPPLMDESNSLQGLTTEILEASISRESVSSDVDELRAFLDAANCFTIQMQLFGVAAFLQTGRAFRTIGELEDFFRSGELDMTRAAEVLQACTKFFMVGWHARGAIEDIERLKRIVRT
jgi:hypothetical protein